MDDEEILSDMEDINPSPPDIDEKATEASLNLQPEISRTKYEIAYKRFMEWRQRHEVKSFSENVTIAHFEELSKTLKASTLWSDYSMVKTTLAVKHDIDISKYMKLRALLKRRSDGFIPKKSKTLTSEEINLFLNQVPDDKYLLTKVELTIGISGACRREELCKLKVSDLEDLKSALLVKIPDTKTKISRNFIVTGIFYEIYKKYALLREAQVNQKRFFLNFQNGKCTKQPVGINKFGNMAKQVPLYLNLPNPEKYTGHCFRRSSATILVNAGRDLLTSKRHGGWRSSAVEEGYIDNSLNNKINVANKIRRAVDEPSTSQFLETPLPSSTTTTFTSTVSLTENVLRNNKSPGTIILGVVLFVVKYDKSVHCVLLLWGLVVGYLAILVLSMVIEVAVCIVALRGSILDTGPRSSMQYILYIRLSVMIIEAGWLSAGIAWLMTYYVDCPVYNAKETVLAMVVFNWCILLSVLITVWCCYDTAGRSWVKMKQYQRSMRESESKFQYKRSGSTRNWRQSLVETGKEVCDCCEKRALSSIVLQRCDVPFFVISRMKVLRAYQDSWQNRCRFLFCCSAPSDRNRNSFADIARLLSDFFRDLDVVPSDVIVGLVLLRKFQKIERKAIVEQRKNDTYEFLSGVAVTPRTQFLSLHDEGADLELFQTVIHFAHFAVKAYGWPVYVMMNKTGVCHLCTGLHCCCIPCRKRSEREVEVVEDNCCQCNYAALQKLTDLGDIEIIYVTYHVDVGETPFFVALDYDRKKIVISIRGTLSMKDILTDLNAESETIPLDPPREDWTGHKGMVQAAQYILEKIEQEELLERARSRNPEKGTKDFEIVIVGHSLGAGTASILGILMRQENSSLQCFCYSPPGGLLSAPAVEYTKEFTVSVVIGKDVVPRIGLHQMETLRTDLINAIKRSVDPKWKTITCSIICCGCSQPTSAVEMSTGETEVCEYMRSKENARCMGIHPSDSTIALTSHQPLYPPGRIIHVVRHHPTSGQQALSTKEPVYQALWASNIDFDEVLISPVMIQDHMPDKVMEALNKCVTGGQERTSSSSGFSKGRNVGIRSKASAARYQVVTTMGPKKPHRSSSTTDSATNYYSTYSNPNLFLETSFASLQSPSSTSSVTNGYFSTKSHPSPLSLHQPLSGFNISIRSNRSDMSFKSQQLSLTKNEEPPSITKSLSLNLVPKVDLIYDDWLGLAPLASPESLSELSSISSRTSLVATSVVVEICSTPKLMRRTPKIIGNLSTCADDIRNVRNFERCKTFPRLMINNNNAESSSSSNLSFESAASSNKCCRAVTRNRLEACTKDTLEVDSNRDRCASSGSDFQSAEDILDNVLSSAGCKEFFNSDSNILELHSDLLVEGSPPPVYFRSSPSTPVYPQVMSPGTPQELDPDILSNLAIDLSLDDEHRSIQFHQSKPSSSVDSGSICRTPSDTTKNVTFNPQVITVDTICEVNYSPPVRWRLFKGKKQKQQIDLPKLPPVPSTISSAVPIKTILSKGKRVDTECASEEQCFSRTEALPLLSGLSNSVNERTPSPSFVKRKKYVYPSDIVVMNKQPPHESAV